MKKANLISEIGFRCRERGIRTLFIKLYQYSFKKAHYTIIRMVKRKGYKDESIEIK
jgi:hypothetical protein